MPLRLAPLTCRWVPVRERSRSLSLVYSGMYTGSMLGLAMSPQVGGGGGAKALHSWLESLWLAGWLAGQLTAAPAAPPLMPALPRPSFCPHR